MPPPCCEVQQTYTELVAGGVVGAGAAHIQCVGTAGVTGDEANVVLTVWELGETTEYEKI